MPKLPEARRSLVENPERTGSLGLPYGQAALSFTPPQLLRPWGEENLCMKLGELFKEYFPKEDYNDAIN